MKPVAFSKLGTHEHTLNNAAEQKSDPEKGKSNISLIQALKKLDGRLLGFLKSNTDKLRHCEVSRIEEDEVVNLQTLMRPNDIANRVTKRSASKSISDMSTKSLKKKKRQSSIGSYIQLDLANPSTYNQTSPYYANQRYDSKYVGPIPQGSTPSIQKRFQCSKPKLGLPKRSLQEQSAQQSLGRMEGEENSYLKRGIPAVPSRPRGLNQRPASGNMCRNKSVLGSEAKRIGALVEESKSRFANSSDSLQLPPHDISLLSKSKSYKQIDSIAHGHLFEELAHNYLSSKMLSKDNNQKLMRRPQTGSRSRIHPQESQPTAYNKENIDIVNVEPSRVAFKDVQNIKEPLGESSHYSNRPKPILKQASDRKLTYLKQEMYPTVYQATIS